MMQLLLVLLATLSLTMLFFGVKWVVSLLKARDVIEFPFTEKEVSFKIKKPGLYAVCIVGGGSIDGKGGFKVQLTQEANQEIIDLRENAIKPRLRKDMILGIEFFKFSITETGSYRIQLENHDDLKVKKSMLRSRQIFQKPEPKENLLVLIKETIPSSRMLMGIIFLVLGVNASAWCIVSLLYFDFFN